MKKIKLELFTDVTGNSIGTNLYEFGQGSSGIYIQGGVHGGEVTYFIFEKIYQWLEKNEKNLKQKITLAPLVNPVAWNQRIYYHTVGKFDLYKGKDWNRSYPGSDTTLTARISKKLFEIAIKNETAIDLHTARISKPYTIFSSKSLNPLVKKIGLPFNFLTDPQLISNSYSGAFDDELMKKGVKSLTLECGSHDEYSKESITTVTNGLLNIISLKHGPTSVQTFTGWEVLYSTSSGFIKYSHAPRTFLKKDDEIAVLYSSEDLKVSESIKAPYDCLLFELPRTHIIWTGDELFKIINVKNIKEI